MAYAATMGKRKRQSAGQAIGGIMAGIDGQIFRSTPPAHELVRKGEAVRGLSGQDGSDLAIDWPKEGAEGEAPPTDEEPPAVNSGGRRGSR
jgi:hypothetical protein